MENNIGIMRSDISYEMKTRYIEYAMSVIAGRALPDVRDGLKPVHRRILYAMHELGLIPDKGFRKCARIVGDVLGKYHPHGDTAVYDALVRMAQDFSIRYTLVNGHGNFGSVDGDSSAHMRYTEAKMNKITLEMLKDINKNTVDFVPNFDGEEQEPCVLPSRFPNLLANGSEGIAVGMSTKIPSHNLTELINGILHLVDNPNTTIKEILKHIPAPDFATGAEIINPQNMQKMYETGAGKIIIRAKYHLETTEKFKQWVFTELPYQSNKAKICEKIAEYAVKKDKVLGVITDVRDESDRDGMRIVVEFKRSIDEDKILATLLKKTDLQVNYNAIFCALVNYEPKVLSLKQMLQYYIDHQKDVIARRTQFELEKAQKRLHILEGLKMAILNIDSTIELIKTSKSASEARSKLIKHLDIDETQANSILDLKLQRLTGLEIEGIEKEYAGIVKTVSYLQSILNNEQELLKVLKEEIIEIKDKYGDERRSALIYKDTIKELSKEDLIEEFNCKILYTKDGYIKKLNKSSEQQKLKEGDSIVEEIASTNKSTLMLFTNKANRYKLPCHTIDICNTPSKSLGEFFSNIVNLEEDEKVIRVVPIENEKEAKGFIVTTYENGKLSKVNIASFISANKKLQKCYSVENPLLDVAYIQEECDVLFISSEGKGLIVNTARFPAKNTKNAQGNKGIGLGEGIKAIASKINPIQSQSMVLITKKNKTKEIRLDNIAPTGKKTEERRIYTYITGKNGNQGNFILNCRSNEDEIVQVNF